MSPLFDIDFGEKYYCQSEDAKYYIANALCFLAA